MMKNTLYATALAAISLAAAAEDKSTISNSLEISGAARFATGDFFDEEMESQRNASIDTYGIEATVVAPITAHHAFTMRVGYAYGDVSPEIVNRWDGGINTITFEHSLRSFYFTSGYRFTYELAEDFSIYAGLNFGIINQAIRTKSRDYYASGNTTYTSAIADHTSEWGALGTAELGFIIDMTKNTYLQIGYEFSYNTAAPSFGDGEASINTDEQCYHSLRIGVGFRF